MRVNYTTRPPIEVRLLEDFSLRLTSLRKHYTDKQWKSLQEQAFSDIFNRIRNGNTN